MGNQLASASAWLAAKLKAHAATEITYTRKGVAGDPFDAVKAQLEHELDDEFEIQERTRRFDWLILPADLVLDGNQVLPQTGDRIIEVTGGDTITYEVAPVVDGEPPWRFTDQHRTQYRVHTQQIRRVST
jgi:hypothetical protein